MPQDDLEEGASGTPPPPDPNANAAGAGGGGPPGGGGPDLAMIAKSRQGPQQSAPGPGDQSASMNKLLMAVQQMQQAMHGLAPGTPLWTAVNRALGQIGRHLPQGAPTVGVQKTGVMDLLRQIGQSGFLQQIMQGGGGGGGPPGGGQQPPMPSMPLPGS